MNDVYAAHAERLADLLLEQLERLAASEHEEAFVLALASQRLVQRAGELGEVIEFEARELDDHAALQMATALQAQCASIQKILAQVAADPRFGLLPTRAASIAPPAPPRGNGHRPSRE